MSLEKIVKLRALARDRAGEPEAENASAMAERLREKAGLTMAQVEQAEAAERRRQGPRAQRFETPDFVDFIRRSGEERRRRWEEQARADQQQRAYDRVEFDDIFEYQQRQAYQQQKQAYDQAMRDLRNAWSSDNPFWSRIDPFANPFRTGGNPSEAQDQYIRQAYEVRQKEAEAWNLRLREAKIDGLLRACNVWGISSKATRDAGVRLDNILIRDWLKTRRTAA